MIITHTADLDEGPLPNSALNGIRLSSEEQFAPFTVHEARIPAGATAPLRSPDAKSCVHVYYCIEGRGTSSATGGGDKHDVRPDTMVALSSDQAHEMTVSPEGAMRLFVVYFPDVEMQYRSLAVVRRLDEVEGTDRDVDWGKGHSWQHLVHRDGFPVGIHKTRLAPGTSLRIAHAHHVEGVYYTSGRVDYRWRPGTSDCSAQSKVDARNGSLFLLSAHDKHTLENQVDAPADCVNVWYPALTGEEGKTTTADGYTGFDAN